MTVPSTKGLLLISAVVGLRRSLESEAHSSEGLGVALEPEDLALLEQKLEPTSWYPVATLGRMNELLAKLAGGDREDALREMGAVAAESVRDTGTYSQMDYEDGVLAEASALELRGFSRQTSTLHEMFFNYGTVRVVSDEAGQIRIHYEGMADHPDSIRLTSEGYTGAMATRALGRSCRVESEDVARDSYTFRFIVDNV